MKKNRTEQIILGVILLLPALFLSAFAIHDALMPTMSCKQACESLDTDFVGCDDDICMCQQELMHSAMHVERYTDDSHTYVVECIE